MSITSINATTFCKTLGFLLLLGLPFMANAQEEQFTFHEDIEPILQRSCQHCHRPGGVGPMTIACLLKNTLEAALRQAQDKPTG